MALTVTNVTTASSTSSSTTLVASNVTASVGDWLIVCVAADNAGSGGSASLQSSMSDTAGNTYTNRTRATQDPGSSNQGTTLGIWTAAVTNAISAGQITANFSPSTAAKAMTVQRVRPAVGEAVFLDTVGTPYTGTSSNATNRFISSVPDNYTLICALAVETSNTVQGDTDTTRGSWGAIYTAVANAGSSESSQSLGTQYKTVTDTGSQTWNAAFNRFSADVVENHLILYDAFDPNVVATPIGVSGVVGLGVAEAFSSAAIDAEGAAATAQVGFVAIAANLEGVSATAAVGGVSVRASAVVAGAGVSSVAALGTAVARVFAQAAVTGVAATAGLGNESVLVRVTVGVIGAQAQALLGSAGVLGGVAVPVTGVQGAFGLGQVKIASELAPVTGVSANTALGSVSTLTRFNALASGVSAQTGLGSSVVRAGAAVPMTGVGATAVVGALGVAVAIRANVSGEGVAALLGSAQAFVVSRVFVEGVQAVVGTSSAQLWTPVNDAQTPGWVPVTT